MPLWVAAIIVVFLVLSAGMVLAPFLLEEAERINALADQESSFDAAPEA